MYIVKSCKIDVLWFTLHYCWINLMTRSVGRQTEIAFYCFYFQSGIDKFDNTKGIEVRMLRLS